MIRIAGLLLDDATATDSFGDIMTQLNTGINSQTLFSTFGQMMPWIIGLVVAFLGLNFLRKALKGTSRGKLKI